MFIHLGKHTVVRADDVIGIFDIEKSTIRGSTKDYLKNAEKNGRVVNISEELPKSFVVSMENGVEKVFISQISSKTLLGRMNLAAKGFKIPGDINFSGGEDYER